MPSPASRRLLRRGLAVAAVVLVALGGAAAFVVLHAPGNVSHPNVQFTGPATSTTVAPSPPKLPRRVIDNFQWPWYGFDFGRTRFFAAADSSLHPPLHVGWHYNDFALLEFPPVIYHGSLFFVADDGVVKAINKTTGRVLWQRKIGTLAAASPAIAGSDGLVLVPLLSTDGPKPGSGKFVALSMNTGRIVWSQPIPAGTESSPIVNGQTVYFGDQAGHLWALSLKDGHPFWSFHATGAIKGGPAFVGGVLYFGDYAGRVYAVNAVSGHQIWSVGTNGAHFGFGSGQFYSSPAVAYGRVYMGNTDGRVYSFGARTGALAWATATGGYVYGSPAIADPPGLGPTVYVGSYDGNMYAFNARSGAIRWRHPSGGKISGSATVIGRTLYYSDLGTKRTIGLDAATGRAVFSFADGAFNPVIADYHAIYLDGYTTIYQLLPGPKPVPKAARKPPRKPARKPSRKPGHKPAKQTAQRRRRATTKHTRRRPRARHRTQPRTRQKPTRGNPSR